MWPLIKYTPSYVPAEFKMMAEPLRMSSKVPPFDRVLFIVFK